MGNIEFTKMLKGEEFDEEALAKYYEFICDDIKRERERIGGDWAVSLFANNLFLKDVIRSKLGPDITFVEIDLAWEKLGFRHRHGEVSYG